MSFKRIHQFLVVIIILFLAINSLLPLFNSSSKADFSLPKENLSKSFVGILLIVCTIGGLIAATVLSKEMTTAQRILHFTLALILTLFAFDKLFEQRYIITLKEKKLLKLNFEGSKNNALAYLYLKKFEIVNDSSSGNPITYRSHILLNNGKEICLQINKPVALDRYHLFLTSFQQYLNYMLIIDQDTLFCNAGDSVNTKIGYITILFPENVSSLPALYYKNSSFLPDINGAFKIYNQKLTIKPAGYSYANTITIVNATRPKILAIIGLFYLLVLAWVFWWKQT